MRRNHRYGTIVCDLERRRIVALLPDREVATVEAWLAKHPESDRLARPRRRVRRGDREGSARAPSRSPIAGLDGKCERSLSRRRPWIDARDPRRFRRPPSIRAELLTAPEDSNIERYLRREETNAAICCLRATLIDQGDRPPHSA